MITEQDLREAIAECEGQRNPNASTCIKLAAFYTIKNQLYGEHKDEDANLEKSYISKERSYSFRSVDDFSIIYDSGTEFSDLISGRQQSDVMPVIDELMTTLSIINPRLYDSVLRKLEER